MSKPLKEIRITHTHSNFEREELLRPFGFKGGYLTELWQTSVQLQSESGNTGIGLSTQSVLYGDADLFATSSEAEGNAFMYIMTAKALQLIKKRSFTTPISLLDTIFPELLAYGKSITWKENLNVNFLFNALVGVDNAAWLIYAAEHKFTNVEEMIPEPYKSALAYRNSKIAVMYQISYGMPIAEMVDAANKGYFVFKIKTGFPGTQEEMLNKDKERLTEIHEALKDFRTKNTGDGKLVYTMDANGRYESKPLLMNYLDHARKIGAFDQILFYEEPFNETNEDRVDDCGVMVAADESVHSEADALKRIKLGYKALVLKGIAKTLSVSLKIAKVAHDHQIPCLCSDLTVNPILVDWHKNLAAHLKPFPQINMGLMETNGDMNYKNWEAMQKHHPYADASWTKVKEGVFELNADFYEKSGGIFTPSSHYKKFFTPTL